MKRPTKQEFCKSIQRLESFIAIGASTVRNQGAPGVVEAARNFLSEMDLSPFGTTNQDDFAATLERETKALQKALPKPAASWGLARKALNVFLRNCLYNHYLRREFRLNRAELLFELPLDSLAVKALKREFKRRSLPTWRGIKGLSSCDSEKFQEYASRLASSRGYARVHLDAEFFPDR